MFSRFRIGFSARPRRRDPKPSPHSIAAPKRRLRLECLEDRRLLAITLYVDDDSTAAVPDGLTWETSYADLQSALDEATLRNADSDPAAHVDAIHLAAGTYRPTTPSVPGTERTETFSLVGGVALVGGYAGLNPNAADTAHTRNVSAYETILSGDLAGNDDPADDGTLEDNAHTVVLCGETVEAALDGVTITAGQAFGSFDVSHREWQEGAGVYNHGSMAIVHATIRGNAAEKFGGGIYNDGTLAIAHSTTTGNCAYYGAAVYSIGGTLSVANSLICGNAAEARAGGIYGEKGTVTITNSTITGNTAPYDAGLFSWWDSIVTLNNTIVALNEATANNDDIFGPFDGSNNVLDVDPGFVRAPSAGADGAWGTPDDDPGDLHLAPTSIAIDAGDNALAVDAEGNVLSFDLDENDRFFGAGVVDVGAYEFQGTATGGETPSTVVTTLDDLVDWTDGQVSLREAAIYATVGGLQTPVTFDPSLPGGTVALGGKKLLLYDSVAIDATSVGGITIDAAGASSVLWTAGTSSEVSLTGLTFTGGHATNSGVGIYNIGATVTISNSTIGGNSSQQYVAGISSKHGVVAINNSTISGNAGYGIRGSSSTITVDHSTISGNDGRGINGVDSMIVVSNSTIDGNTGGGIYCGVYDIKSPSTVLITNSTISGNFGADEGSGIYFDPGCQATLANTIVAYNGTSVAEENVVGPFGGSHNLIGGDPGFVRAPSAGADGIWGTDDDEAGDLRLTAGSIAVDTGDNAAALDSQGSPLTADLDGNARFYGGGTVDIGAYEFQGTPQREVPSAVVTMLDDVVDYSDGQVSIREALLYTSLGRLAGPVTFDPALAGGTITLGGTSLYICDSATIDATSVGGITIDAAGLSRALSVTGTTADVSLLGLTITGGQAVGEEVAGYGGGIGNAFATLTIARSTIHGNSASEGGGGLANFAGMMTVVDSMITTNSASGSGGGVYNYAGMMSIVNSVINGNSAANDGGGIENDQGIMTVVNSTIAGNSAADTGGGIHRTHEGALTLSNTIVALNRAAHEEDVRGGFSGSNNLVGLDPAFVRAPSAGADGIWSTEDDDPGDLHLTAESIAVDTGDNALTIDALGNPLATDLDGNARIFPSGVVDLGAYEFQGAPIARETPSTVVTTLDDLVDWRDGQVSLREAVVYATLGGLHTPVTFASSLSGGTITLGGRQLSLFESVAIDATSIGGITIDAAGLSRVFYIAGPTTEVSLTGLTITGGQTTADGGGIYNIQGTVLVDNSAITGNSATEKSSYGGGIDSSGGTVVITNSTISGNSASYGGGIYASGLLTVSNSTVSGNTASYSGGGIYNNRGAVTLDSSTVSANFGEGGGGIRVLYGTLSVANSSISDNVGGGIHNDEGTVLVADSIFSANSVPSKYGRGGGIHNDQGALTVAGSTFEGNSVGQSGEGGGIYNHLGTATVTTSTFSSNSVGQYGEGGGICNREGALTVTAVSFFSNLTGDHGDGGGIYNSEGALTVTGSTFAGNCTLGSGTGAGICSSNGTVEVVNSTFSGNSAGSVGLGGGIYSNRDMLTVTSSTIAGNSSGLRGGGIGMFVSDVYIENTIVAQNVASEHGPDVYGTIDGSHNLIGNGSDMSWRSGDNGTNLVGVDRAEIDPRFRRPPSDGGDGWGDDSSTPDVDESANDDYGNLRLLPGSPAIDAGDSARLPADVFDLDGDGDTAEPLPVDLGGNARVIDGDGDGTTALDIGAFEFQGGPIIDVRDADLSRAYDVDGGLLIPSESITRELSIVNIGSAELVVTPPSALMSTFAFTVTDGDWVLSRGETKTVVVQFEPPAPGVFSDTLTLSSNDLEEPTYSITLRGECAAPLVVDTLSDEDDGNHSAGNLCLREAMGLAAAQPGADVILFDPTLFLDGTTAMPGTILLTAGELYYESDVTDGLLSIRGPGPELLTIDAQGGSRVMSIIGANTEVLLSGVTITGGNADNRDGGGGIYTSWSTLTIVDSLISGNTTSEDGGGLLNVGGTVAVIDSTISKNSADDGGGIQSRMGTVTIEKSTVSQNYARLHGGGIYSTSGTLSVANSVISSNYARSGAGGIYSFATGRRGMFTIACSTISKNSASGQAGGLYINGSAFALSNSIVWDNHGYSNAHNIYAYSGITLVASSLVSMSNGEHGISGDWTDAGGNLLGVDPLFVRYPSDGGDGFGDDPDTPDVDESANDDCGDLRLLAASPAIDAGDSTWLGERTAGADFNGDGDMNDRVTVDLSGDARVYDGNGDGTATVDMGAYEYQSPGVIDRRIFYNNSCFDDFDPAANAQDDTAIATDKTALLPGETATFDNYTSYYLGINGVMVDLAGVPDVQALSADDFKFHTGNDDNPGGWAEGPVPIDVQVRVGAGAYGTDRVTIVFADHAIENTWLQVTVLANERTGLPQPEVFYFGNAVGESGDSTEQAMVTSGDEIGARYHPQVFTPTTVDNHWDYNRDGRVSSIDQIIARWNRTVLDQLQLITPTAAPPAAAPAAFDAAFAGDAAEAMGKIAWVYDFEKLLDGEEERGGAREVGSGGDLLGLL